MKNPGKGAGRLVPRWTDAKRIHRALFGVYYQEDIFEHLCGMAPLAMRALVFRLPLAMRRRKLIFVHVPRAAGTSIAQALYGPHCIQHHSARYYRALAPEFWRDSDSFALVRDPFDRFASSYAFVRGGGAENARLSEVFQALTARLRSVDDYLSFIEGRDIFDLDFVMRPQSWFVSDLESGAVLVKRLFLYDENNGALAAYLKGHGIAGLPWLNRAIKVPLALSSRQKSRVEKIYAQDFVLVENLRQGKASAKLVPLAGIAAE
jgi:hypothetical protein